MMAKENETRLHIGWAARDVTPDQAVVLGAQFNMRISEGVDGPVTVTALAISGAGQASDAVIFVSCDLTGFRHRWFDENDFLELCRSAILKLEPELAVRNLILNATHTHTSPQTLIKQFGLDKVDSVMTVDAYMEFLLSGIAKAVSAAWHDRKPAGVSWGLGTAVVGHNRRATYFLADDTSRPGETVNTLTRMYGETDDPNFSHIEGYEDHYVNLLYTWDSSGNLTGVVINIACPAQETENAMTVSADFWHEVRVEIRRRHGEHIQILAQSSAAGDQSPHRLWYKEAEDLMLKLRGLTMRQEIGRRIANAVDDVLPFARKSIQQQMILRHLVKEIYLPRRMVSEAEIAAARLDLEKLEEEAQKGKNNYRVAQRVRRVIQRYEQQEIEPLIPMTLHVVRLGDIAFATNRFELFLDYGVRLKARSPAVLTFLVQLTADDVWDGTYLPSERAFASQGYGACVYGNEVGPEGGKVLVEETVGLLDELWPEPSR